MSFGALYRLTKPGVTYGNLITTIAGYLFAANGHIDWSVFIALTIGTWFVIASACVINNYLDQDIDMLMERTKKRPLLTKEVSGRQAVIFGTMLGVLGTILLAVFTNWWVVGVGIFGWIVYVWFYGALGKRRSVHGTLVGSLSGAAPILAGYVAVSNGLDLAAILLFLALFFWQLPEFYSIAIYRQKEYAKAGVPIITVIWGIRAAQIQIFFYTLATAASILLLSITAQTSFTYFVVMLSFCFYWIGLAVEGLLTKEPEAWSRHMFHFSLVVLVVLCLALSLNFLLP